MIGSPALLGHSNSPTPGILGVMKGYRTLSWFRTKRRFKERQAKAQTTKPKATKLKRRLRYSSVVPTIKKRLQKVRTNCYYIFLVAGVVLIAFGLYTFFHQGIQTSHFFGISVKPTSETTLVTEAYISGQYKTIGKGFFVGKRITISALLYLQDRQLYDQIKNLAKDLDRVVIENSEAPEDAERDISEAVGEGNIDKAFTNPGTVRMVKFYDDKQTIVLEGDVVFTKEGVIAFGQPLKGVLDSYGITIQGMPVEPASTKYQIDLNRTVLLLTFLTISVACLSVFFGFSKKG